MNSHTHSNRSTLVIGAGLVAGLILTFLITLPSFASAAVYAYVDTAGEVKSVTAADWMTALAIAPNIHMNSGVVLLSLTSDYEIIGETVTSAQ